jgi:hypothetical protein
MLAAWIARAQEEVAVPYPRRGIRCPTILTLLLAGLLLPEVGFAARAGRPRAAVTFLEASDQPRSALKSLRALVEAELEQHSISVVRKPAPPLVSSSRQVKRYARASRLDRVYDVRLRPRGKQVEVVLTERRPPAMRSTFSARLSAAGLERVSKVIPKLVGAVVAREDPGQEQEPKAEVVADATPQAEVKAQPTAPPDATPAPDPVPGGSARRGQILVGASLDMGTFLHSAAGLYGGTAKIFYQWTSLRLGAELGGSGGGGTTFHLAARGDYLFSQSGLSPYLGGGLGYVLTRDGSKAEGGGGYFSAVAGLEYSRWRKVHLLAEADVMLPFFSARREEVENRNGIVELVGVGAWSPAILFKLGCLY